jgi:hypothetical protein
MSPYICLMFAVASRCDLVASGEKIASWIPANLFYPKKLQSLTSQPPPTLSKRSCSAPTTTTGVVSEFVRQQRQKRRNPDVSFLFRPSYGQKRNSFDNLHVHRGGTQIGLLVFDRAFVSTTVIASIVTTNNYAT